MFLFSSNKTKKNELSLIVEIQSGLVKGSLVIFEGNEAPTVIFTTTKIIHRKEHTVGSHLIKMMLKTVTNIAETVSKEGSLKSKEHGLPIGGLDTIHYVMSSPWVVSHSRSLKIKYDNDTEITEKIIKDFIKDDYKSLIAASGVNEKDSENNSDLSCIEQKVFEIKLNGYPVVSYEGKKTKTLEVAFASTLGSKHVIEKIHMTVSHFLHSRYRAVHSSPLLYFSAFRSLANLSDFISIHVHGELSDVVVVKNSICVCIASFPYGISTFLRGIQDELKQESSTSGSLISLLYSGKLEESEEIKVRKVIESLSKHWYATLMKSIESFSEKLYIPRLLYISSYDHFQLFKDAIIKNNEKGITFEVNSFDNFPINEPVNFDKSFKNDSLLAMYVLALKNML